MSPAFLNPEGKSSFEKVFHNNGVMMRDIFASRNRNHQSVEENLIIKKLFAKEGDSDIKYLSEENMLYPLSFGDGLRVYGVKQASDLACGSLSLVAGGVAMGFAAAKIIAGIPLSAFGNKELLDSGFKSAENSLRLTIFGVASLVSAPINLLSEPIQLAAFKLSGKDVNKVPYASAYEDCFKNEADDEIIKSSNILPQLDPENSAKAPNSFFKNNSKVMPHNPVPSPSTLITKASKLDPVEQEKGNHK